jgi:hypothetical protein
MANQVCEHGKIVASTHGETVERCGECAKRPGPFDSIRASAERLRSCGAEPEHPHLIDCAEDAIAEALREAEERGAMWALEAAVEVARETWGGMNPDHHIAALSPAEVCAARRGR